MSLKDKVKELLDEAGSSTLESAFFHQEICEGWSEDCTELETTFQDASIGFTCVDSHGGEGEGEDFYTVYKFTNSTDEDVYVKFQGWYQSYNGSEFTDYRFVQPVQRMVTFYE